MSGHSLAADGVELVVIPADGQDPLFLLAEGAAAWRDLVAEPVPSGSADIAGTEILEQFADMGIASRAMRSSARFSHLDKPWLVSPLTELVYALLAKVAAEHDIDIVFIKGPTLHAQGLRAKEHSGDVDCWVRRADVQRLTDAMRAWGWAPHYLPLSGTAMAHALTLQAGAWGCDIDVHSHFPGIGVDPDIGLEILIKDSEERVFAGISARTPSREMHAVIEALHLLRPYRGHPPAPARIDAARKVLRAAGDQVIDAAERLGAEYVLGPHIEASFPESAGRFRDAQEPEDWAWRQEPYGARRLVRALRFVPWRQRGLVLRRLVWPPSNEMRIAHRIPDESAWGLARRRIRRIVGGAGGIIRGR